MAEWLHKKGVIRTANPSTVGTWEAQQVLGKQALKKLAVLKELGVNPDYLTNPGVTEWEGVPVREWDESKIAEIEQRLAKANATAVKLLSDVAKLKAQKEELKDQLEKALAEIKRLKK